MTATLEHFLFGLFPDEIDGKDKIQLYASPGIRGVLSDRNYQILRELQQDSSHKHFWLPDEQVVALPHIETVEDSSGRTWTRNHTVVIPIHIYIQLTEPFQTFSSLFTEDLEKPENGLQQITLETVTLE